jgi:hypothetical protein
MPMMKIFLIRNHPSPPDRDDLDQTSSAAQG